MAEMSSKVRNAYLISKRKVADATLEYSFTFKDEFNFEAGQYIWLELRIKEKYERRAFSIVSTPRIKNEIKIVFREGESEYKKCLQDLNLKSKVTVIGPFGSSLVIPKDTRAHIIFIAGGVGVAPFVSLINHHSETGSFTQITLVTMNSDIKRAPYAEELRELTKKDPSFTLYEEYGNEIHDEVFSRLTQLKDHKFYICGSQTFIDYIYGNLRERNIDKKQMHFEQFYPTSFSTQDLSELSKEKVETENTDSIRYRISHQYFPWIIGVGLITSIISEIAFYVEGMVSILNIAVMIVLSIFLILWKFESLRKTVHDLLLLGALILLFHMYVFQGEKVTGIYWIYFYPLFAFVMDKKKGPYWVIAYILVLGLAVGAHFSGLYLLPYPSVVVIQSYLSLLFVSLLAYIIALIEMSSQRELQKAIKHERLFRQAVESTTNHIIFTDANGYIYFANRAAEQMTGFSFSEMKGSTPRLWGGEMKKEYYRDLWSKKSKGKSFDGEIINRKKDGYLYTALAHISPIKDKKDAVIGYIATEEDISKIKEIDKMKTEFLSVASHQLRTPLGSMKWNLESLLAGDAGVLKKDIKEILKDVYDSNKRMLTLVNDLLNVSRIDQGRIKDDPKETDIKELIDASIREMGPLAKQKDVEISTQIASRLPHITLDPTRFYEVIKNLLSNGVKYNKPGGMVTINVEHSGDFVSIKVTDTGMGIPRNDQPKIFSKFFRAKNAVVSETEGTGLGLFVVKSYVEGWGGAVECKSTEGKGTEFTLRIPRKVHTIVTTREIA